jgi:hypothetical protein
VPDDVSVSYQFDESPIVYRAIESVGVEGALGAGLTGLMVLMFLRDLRAVIVVVLNIPLALLGSIVVLNLTGNTINIMTLGGLALAIGILVDEATVEIENIHPDGHTPRCPGPAARKHGTAVPRLLALVHPLGVRRSSCGGGTVLFVPLSLAVGGDDHVFLSSTFVQSSRLAARNRHGALAKQAAGFTRIKNVLSRAAWMIAHRRGGGAPYLVATGRGGVVGVNWAAAVSGRRSPVQLRVRPPQGTHYRRPQVAQRTPRRDRRGGRVKNGHDGVRRRAARRSSPSI